MLKRPQPADIFSGGNDHLLLHLKTAYNFEIFGVARRLLAGLILKDVMHLVCRLDRTACLAASTMCCA